MADKILNTRIQSKIDTLENWNKSEIGLLKGEIAIATVAAEAGNGLTEPVYMIKIGEDGIKTFKDLEWNLYAKASDVLAACKDEKALTDFILEAIENSDLVEELSSLLENLTNEDNAVDGQYVSAVIQTEGNIEVVREKFPNFLQDISIEIGAHEGKKYCIILKDGNSEVVSYVDAAEFVKDGMLDAASYDALTHTLTLSWNTDAGKTDTVIALEDLVTNLTAGEGLEISDSGKISLSEELRVLLSESIITTITTNDIVKSETETVPSGLIATKGENNDYNIAIDDSITFIFNCGDAGVTTSPDGGETTE